MTYVMSLLSTLLKDEKFRTFDIFAMKVQSMI